MLTAQRNSASPVAVWNLRSSVVNARDGYSWRNSDSVALESEGKYVFKEEVMFVPLDNVSFVVALKNLKY